VTDPPRYPDPEPEAGDDTGAGPGRDSRPGMPRWVKVSLIVIAVLVVMVIILSRVGGHEGGPGPGGHGFGGGTPPSSVIEGGVRPA
jgi:hypothetical protein